MTIGQAVGRGFTLNWADGDVGKYIFSLDKKFVISGRGDVWQYSEGPYGGFVLSAPKGKVGSIACR